MTCVYKEYEFKIKYGTGAMTAAKKTNLGMKICWGGGGGWDFSSWGGGGGEQIFSCCGDSPLPSPSAVKTLKVHYPDTTYINELILTLFALFI